MSVVEAKIQTVEDMYRLIWTAIANKQPISAIYKERYRLFCPHRLGRNRLGQPRVLCYQYGGESETGLAPIGSPENWRCVIFEKLKRVELVNDSWRTAPNHSRPTTCVIEVDIDAEHAACHLTRQDWGVPIVVTADGASRLPLVLRGLDQG